MLGVPAYIMNLRNGMKIWDIPCAKLYRCLNSLRAARSRRLSCTITGESGVYLMSKALGGFSEETVLNNRKFRDR